MKYVDEFRDPKNVLPWKDAIAKRVSKSWNIMEICGGQTHNIAKFGIDSLLPTQVQLVHGPGCPVCVTPLSMIDSAVTMATRPNVILCSFGDMLRVPGSKGSLLAARARGADVRVVYSPRDALQLAKQEPKKEVIFFAVGFETTAPMNATAIAIAKRDRIENFSAIVSQVLVPPAMEAILSASDCTIQGFLAAGHVCTVTGYENYYRLAHRFKVPIVVTGFEPLDILQGIYICIEQLESQKCEVVNQYSRSSRLHGNPKARALVEEVFEICDFPWRGIGILPESGLRLRSAYAQQDALVRFGGAAATAEESTLCRAGDILQGKAKPNECSAFGKSCHPENPLGAPMVSNEGACAAYYQFKLRSADHD